MKTLLIALALTTAPAIAESAGTVEVVQPWSRPAAAGTNGIGYMVLVNRGPAADALEKVETPFAARVEMHSSSMAGGVMSMQKEDRVAIPAGGRATFGPGAYHLMLIGLTRALAPGDKVPATLSFASGARIKTAFTVSSGMGPPAMAGMAH
jgi:copper(I)-binding protein